MQGRMQELPGTTVEITVLVTLLGGRGKHIVWGFVLATRLYNPGKRQRLAASELRGAECFSVWSFDSFDFI